MTMRRKEKMHCNCQYEKWQAVVFFCVSAGIEALVMGIMSLLDGAGNILLWFTRVQAGVHAADS